MQTTLSHSRVMYINDVAQRILNDALSLNDIPLEQKSQATWGHEYVMQWLVDNCVQLVSTLSRQIQPL